MKATIPQELPKELADACQIILSGRRNMAGWIEQLKKSQPERAEAIEAANGWLNLLIDQVAIDSDTTLGELLAAVELMGVSRN